MHAARRQLDPRGTWSGSAGTKRLLAAAGLVALLGGMGVVVLSADSNDSAETAAPTTTSATPPPEPIAVPPARVRIAMAGAGAYDPEGDQSENGADAGLATDGDPATAWKSEHYRAAFTKSGVGLVLDAGKPVKVSRVVVTTDTPGYDAQVQVGDSATGPFTAVSGSKQMTTRTVYAPKPRQARYLMLWITSMPAGGVAEVNEVAVSAGG